MKITKGNDFTMRIPVCKMEGGEPIPYPLPACTDIVVNLVNAFRRRPLTFTIDVAMTISFLPESRIICLALPMPWK